MAEMSVALTGAPPREAQRWLTLLLVVAITAVGVFLRFHTLGIRSLWPPECFSVLVARQPWPVFLRTMWWGEGNMAFYYTLLRGWLLFGDSGAWLQGLSALFGALAVPAVYFLGRRFLSQPAGLIAAALLAIHSFHIERSALVRSYSLLTLLIIVSTCWFLALLDSPNKKSLWALYVVFSALAFYAQTLVIFVLFAQWLALGAVGIKRLGLWRLLAAGFATAILSAPLLAVMVLAQKGQLDWVPPLSLHGFLNVLWGVTGANMLALHSLGTSLVLLILYVACWVAAAWGSLRERTTVAGSSRRAAIAVTAWSLVFPIVAMAAISLVKPILYPRFLLMCVPFAVLLAAQGIVTIAQSISYGRLVSFVLLILMAALSLLGTREFQASLQTPGLDWRGVSKYILARRQPTDAVVFYTFGGIWAWDYFVGLEREAGDSAPVPATIFPLGFDPADIKSKTAPYRRVWLVLQQDIPTPQSDANTALLVQTMNDGFHIVEDKEFGGKSIYPGESVTIRLSLYSTEKVKGSPEEKN
jgi:4-amino-4-deoxy-L-arabinose transferase-like glycosyltransferase